MKIQHSIPILFTLPLIIIGCDGITDIESKKPKIAINDTGVDWCAEKHKLHLECPVADYPGQDAQQGRDQLAKQGKLRKRGGGAAGFDFTKLDKHGRPLPKNATQWPCVRDNHTGLEWEIKTTDGGLQHHRNTYSWYNPDPTRNGGNPGGQNGGICQGSPCDTQAYVAAINKQGLCSHKDWRLPEIGELISLVHYGREKPTIDTDYLPNTPIKEKPQDGRGGGISPFWSTTTKSEHTDEAIYNDFSQGEMFYRSKTRRPSYLRLVRGSQHKAQKR